MQSLDFLKTIRKYLSVPPLRAADIISHKTAFRFGTSRKIDNIIFICITIVRTILDYLNFWVINSVHRYLHNKSVLRT